MPHSLAAAMVEEPLVANAAPTAPTLPPRRFDDDIHHPFLEGMKHATSPLSVALFVYFMGKANIGPQLKAWWRASSIVRQAARSPPKATSAGQHPPHHHHNQQQQQQQVRQAHTWAVGRSINSRSNALPPRFGTAAPFGSLAAARLYGIAPLTAAAMRLHSTTAVAAAPDAVAPAFHSIERIGTYWHPDDTDWVLHHAAEAWLPTHFESLLLELHQASGLPWWLTLMTSTALLRLAVVPINTLYIRNHLRVKLLREEMTQACDAMASSNTPEKRLHAAQEVLQTFHSRSCHPVMATDLIIPVIFPVVFLSYFFSIHNLCLVESTMATGGTLWFKDLMAPDPANFLPIVSGMTWLGVLEQSSSQLYMTSPRIKLWTRLGAVALIPLTMTLPAGVFCFWITSNVWELIRISLMHQDGLRRRLGIPLSSELPPIRPAVW